MNKTGLKNLLRNEIIKMMNENRRYFSRQELYDLVCKGHSPILSSTLNRYLVDFNKEGVLYGAGRGWYSFIKQSFELERLPVKKITTTLGEKYPLLSFSVWSTEQLKSFAHHLLARFVMFVYVDRDAMSGVYDFLKDAGYDTWLNPRGNDAQKFSIGEKTVVIRPTISRERSSVHYADIEKVFVDLFVEAAALNLMDEDECYRILVSVLTVGRVDIGAFLSYAQRRKLDTMRVVEQIKSI
ncbi:MAG: DUF6577 family protein [Syntrophales bacterium]